MLCKIRFLLYLKVFEKIAIKMCKKEKNKF